MFAGIDSESVLSVEPPVRLQRSKSAAHPRRHGLRESSQNPFVDPVEDASRVSVREEMFGWSGSVGGIRGRDDRQIERDTEFERKMEERTRKRHERKLARQQQVRGNGEPQPPLAPGSSKTPQGQAIQLPSYEPIRRRPVFAPTVKDLEHENQKQTSCQENQPESNLSRGKSLRDRVGAAFGRWNSVNRSKSFSALDTQAKADEAGERKEKEKLGGIVRRLSRKLTIEDQERRRKAREETLYAGVHFTPFIRVIMVEWTRIY